jgi:4-amino-4-deoxy-L-arabinose transferase-like glycosyltransferase
VTQATKIRTAAPQPLSPAAGSSQTRLIVVMILVIAPLIVLSQILSYWRDDVVDDQMFAYYGWRLAHGATVYLDVWDNKPPGIYWINAIGMLGGGGSYLGVIAMCSAALVVAHAAFYVAAKAVYHRSAAALTTILLAVYLMHARYTGGTDRTETFLVPCELIGVAFYLHAHARNRWWMWYGAGLFCGAAFLFKQVGLAAWGCMGLHTIALVLFRDLRFTEGLRRCVLLAVGAATTIGAAALYLAAQGALAEAWFATFTFNRAYFSARASQFPYNYANWKLLENEVYPILLVPLLMSVAALVHGFLWWLRPKYRPVEIEQQLADQRPTCPKYLLFMALWTLTAFYGAIMSPHAFRHYLVPTIAPLLFLSGYLINVLRAETKLLRRMQQRAWVTFAFVALGYFAWGALKMQFQEMSKVWVFRIDPATRELREWVVLGRALAEVTQPGDRVQCWGYLPGVYLEARRINATRFSTTEKVGQVGGGARFVIDEMERKLKADPPAALVIPASDYFWMWGRVPGAPPSDFQLGPWIAEHYVVVREVPKFGTHYIFKRKDLVGPDTPPIAIELPEIPPDSQPAGGS